MCTHLCEVEPLKAELRRFLLDACQGFLCMVVKSLWARPDLQHAKSNETVVFCRVRLVEGRRTAASPKFPLTAYDR